MMKSKMTFPKLSRTDIVKCLKDLGMQRLTEDDFDKPQPDFVHSLYENVVHKLMGYTFDDLNKPIPEVYKTIEHPNLYDNAIYEINFIKKLICLMTTVGVDFHLNDLISPTYPRMHHFLSGIINFARYREDKFVRFYELDADLSRLTEDYAMAEERRATVLDDLDNAKSQLIADEPRANKLFEETRQLEVRVRELNAEASTEHARSESLQKEIDEYDKRIAMLDSRQEALQADIDETSAQIVKNPESERQILSQLRASAEEDRRKQIEYKKRRNEHSSRLQVIQTSKQQLEECAKQLDNVVCQINKMASIKKQIREKTSEIDGLGREIEKSHTRIYDLKQNLNMEQGRLDRLCKQMQEENEKHALYREKSCEDQFQNQSRSADLAKSIDEAKIALSRLKRERQEHLQRHNKDINMLQWKWEQATDEFQKYYQNLMNAMAKCEERQKLLEDELQLQLSDSSIQAAASAQDIPPLENGLCLAGVR